MLAHELNARTLFVVRELNFIFVFPVKIGGIKRLSKAYKKRGGRQTNDCSQTFPSVSNSVWESIFQMNVDFNFTTKKLVS